MIDSEKDGVGYRVSSQRKGKQPTEQDNVCSLCMPFSDKEVFQHHASNRWSRAEALAQILLGAALITTAIIIVPGAQFGASGFAGVAMGEATKAALAATLAAAGGNLGIALTLGGIAQAISPQPDSGLERGREAAQLESFVFNNVVNTAKQGLPVPIAYGRVFVGSAVLSSGLDVDQKRT